MKPTEKSPKITKLLNNLSGRSDAIIFNKCIPKPIGCGRDLTQKEMEAWDTLSIQEYRINGLCLDCQNDLIE